MTKTLTAPMKLADEMLSTVAGGHDHGHKGCWKRERGHGHGHGRRFSPGSSKSVSQDVDVFVDASNNSGTIIINVNTSA